MMKQRFIALLCALAISALSLVGCAGANDPASSGIDSDSQNNETAAIASNSDYFTDRDFEVGYSNYVTVTLADGGTTADGNGVTVAGDQVTLTDEGTYLLTGSLTNGQIVVDADSTDKIQLVLDNADITNSSSAAIYIKQADKVFLTLAPDSQNNLTVSGDYVQTDDNTVDAAIFSKDDLTLNGTGGLVIKAQYGHGVVSKDDLVITGGSYEITAASHGLSGKDRVCIANGDFTIVAGKDGIHAENADDAQLGYLYIANGNYNITAGTDGLDTKATLRIDDGNFTLTTGGGSANASTTADGEMRPGWGEWETTATDDSTQTSAKGIKATGDMLINGGSYTIDSSDDAFHSNGNLTIQNGTIDIASGDDGMHADTALLIADGDINITKSYEGLEGQSVEIAGGTVSIVASDDGLNAAGGADSSGMGGRPGAGNFTASADCYLIISGGTTHIDASGDGMDSNGALTMTGGTVYLDGPTNGGNGSLDYAGEGSITGGTIVAAGSVGMAQNFGSTSTQGTMLVNLTTQQSAGSTVTLQDSSGNTVAQYTPTKQYQSVVISAPGVVKGETYTLTAGTETQSIQMTDTVYGSGGMGGMGGGMGGGGGKPGGGMMAGDGTRPERPDGAPQGGQGEAPPDAPTA